MKHLFLIILLVTCCSTSFAQRYHGAKASGSGGPLKPLQGAYNVHSYQINLRIRPNSKSIDGSSVAFVKVTSPISEVLLDLDNRLTVRKASEFYSDRSFNFNHKDGRLLVTLDRTYQPGEKIAIKTTYGGSPKEAVSPPWVGGFSWKKTKDGQPWIATSMQFDGGDLWFPCKDHPSDEPDSVNLFIEVDQSLVVASNGTLQKVRETQENTKVHHWKISNPINNYNITLNIAPYKTLEQEYTNVNGEKIPMYFYVLPENLDKAKKLFPEFMEHLAFYEKYLGPYPFRNEKYGVSETPFLGMEHQTNIAYGSDYKPNEFGYDFLHHHELGHEWWGNMVTAADWKDFWIHEGFCSYMQALYNEERLGKEAYHKYFENSYPKIRNQQTMAPTTSKTTTEVYFAAPFYKKSDGDIYTKGAWFLHTLRYVVGDEAFLKSLRLFCYPNPESESYVNGKQCRFVSTNEYKQLIESLSGKKLDWLFDIYLHQPQLPNILVNHTGKTLSLEWDTPNNMDFPMPIEISIKGKTQMVDMSNGKVEIPLKKLSDLKVDPNNWILKKSNWQDKVELRNQLSKISGIWFEEIPARDHFKQSYHIVMDQELDHSNPKSSTFEQHIYLSHSDPERPTLIETCGYESYDNTKEISQMTLGNQLVVEYRYFGKSKPVFKDGKTNWDYLRNEQAVEDYHRIVTSFKSIYTGKWVSSGVSKGGANCITYRSQYPNDVDVTIPYVAPIALDREDDRTIKHIQTIGDGWCRDSAYAFQKMLLERRDEIIPLLKEWAGKKGYTYSVGYETALEYAAYEYTFSFWQWYGDCNAIPGKNSSAEEMFKHVNQSVGWSFYSDKTIERLGPSYYQHMVELGYYGFEEDHIKPLMKKVFDPDNMFFTPDTTGIPKYDGTFMKNVWNYATNKGNNFIYIYGEYDTWSACAITPASHLNSLKMVKQRGTHGTRIRHFSKEEKLMIYKALAEWLDCEIIPLK